MIGQILGCAVFGYFAVVSLMNARSVVVHRQRALEDFGRGRQREASSFLRLWLAVNLLSFALMTIAAILVWFNGLAAVVLACVPVLFFAVAHLMGKSGATP